MPCLHEQMWIYGFSHKANDRARVVRKDNESEGIRRADGVEDNERKNPVAMRLWDTPVLIPNTMVKT